MLKKFIFFSLFLLSACNQADAGDLADQKLIEEDGCASGFPIATACLQSVNNCKVALRCAEFFPLSKRFRSIYKRGIDYQLECSRTLFCHWEIWGGADWYYKKGRSIGYHKKTTVWIANLN